MLYHHLLLLLLFALPPLTQSANTQTSASHDKLLWYSCPETAFESITSGQCMDFDKAALGLVGAGGTVRYPNGLNGDYQITSDSRSEGYDSLVCDYGSGPEEGDSTSQCAYSGGGGSEFELDTGSVTCPSAVQPESSGGMIYSRALRVRDNTFPPNLFACPQYGTVKVTGLASGFLMEAYSSKGNEMFFSNETILPYYCGYTDFKGNIFVGYYQANGTAKLVYDYVGDVGFDHLPFTLCRITGAPPPPRKREALAIKARHYKPMRAATLLPAGAAVVEREVIRREKNLTGMKGFKVVG